MPAVQLIPRLRDLPFSWRITLTVFVSLIGAGYLFGILNIYHKHRFADDKPELTFDDLLITFSGKEVPVAEGESVVPASRMLEQVLPGGGMRKHLEKGGPQSVGSLITWLEKGGTEGGFTLPPDGDPAGPSPEKVITAQCLRCHNADGGEKADTPYGPDMFTVDFAMVREVAQPPVGPSPAPADTVKTRKIGPASVSHLVQVTHAHIMSIPVFTLIIFLLFQGSDMPRGWKAFLGPLPMVALVVDLAGWWLARLDPLFIHILSLSGAVIGGGLAIQMVSILVGLWLCKPTARAGSLAEDFV